MGFGQAQKITWICNPVGPVPMGTGKGRGLDLWTLRIADSFLRCGMSPLQRGPELAQDGTRYHCVHRCTQWYLAFLQDSGEKQVSPFQDWPMLVWGHITSPRLCIIIVAFFHFLGKELHSDLKQSVGSLLDFYARHGLAFTNSMFAYKVALTCICLGRKTVIYFFVLDTQMKKGVEVLSDHHLVVSWTRWWREGSRTAKPNKKWTSGRSLWTKGLKLPCPALFLLHPGRGWGQMSHGQDPHCLQELWL